MNIQVQICGIILLTVMILFYSGYRSLGLITGKIYRLLLWTSLCCVILDVMSLWAIENMLLKSRVFVEIVCKAYLISLVAVGLMGLLYECAVVCLQQWKLKKTVMFCTAFFLAVAAAISCLPIYIKIDDSAAYTTGLSVLVTYASAGCLVLAAFIMTIAKRRQSNPRSTQTMLAWLAIWVIAALIQFFNNEWLLAGYAVAIGNTILFFRLENPEFLVDRATGLYNPEGFFLYIRSLFWQTKEFAAMSVRINQNMNREAENGKNLNFSFFV